MSRLQPSLFEGARMTLPDAIDLTAQSLVAFGSQHKHWAVAYSGGKDSSATLSVVWYLIQTGRVPAPETLNVLYADTRMELPPLHSAAMQMLDNLRDKGVDCRVVLPALDDRFFVYMFGRGVPPPSNTFRWCTPQIKIEPMENALLELREQFGEKFLMLTGVRIGESAKRDDRIALSCGKNGAECGQGWYQESTPEHVADTLAPLLHWRICHVWDWLMFEAPGLSDLPTHIVAESYGGDDAQEVNARTGCVGCNLASRDLALITILKLEKWQYLQPLMNLRPLYAELKKAKNRLRKDGTERRKDGTLVSNPMRLGPLTFEAREWGLREVLHIQDRVNSSAKRNGQPEVILINAEEETRIHELIEAQTWPNRWAGTEPTGDVMMDDIISEFVSQPLIA